jgi:hypothetical protein
MSNVKIYPDTPQAFGFSAALPSEAIAGNMYAPPSLSGSSWVNGAYGLDDTNETRALSDPGTRGTSYVAYPTQAPHTSLPGNLNPMESVSSAINQHSQEFTVATRSLEAEPSVDYEPQASPSSAVRPQFLTSAQHDVQWICRWKQCGQTLIGDVIIEHFKNTHPLPANRSDRVCEWEGCTEPLSGGIRERSPWRHLRGRFHANLVDLKCPIDGCESFFSRSEYVKRHLKKQHGILREP